MSDKSSERKNEDGAAYALGAIGIIGAGIAAFALAKSQKKKDEEQTQVHDTEMGNQ